MSPEDEVAVACAKKTIRLAKIMLGLPDSADPPLRSAEWWDACRYANRLVAAGVEATDSPVVSKAHPQ